MALFPGERLAGAAKSLLAASTVPRMQYSFMYYSDFLYENPNLVATPLADLATTYWGSGHRPAPHAQRMEHLGRLRQLHLRPLHREPRPPRPGQLRPLQGCLARL